MTTTPTDKPTTPPASVNGTREIPLTHIIPNPNQPRQNWSTEKDEEGRTALQRLGQSIHEQGVLQPLIVTQKNGKYMIVCGERRFQATKKHTSLKTIPCIVREIRDERTMMELSVTENLQRENLTPMDEAMAYKVLIDKCKYSVRALAKKLGISPAGVSQKLSLLKLTPALQKDVATGKLSETQGTVIAQSVSKQPKAKQSKALKKIKKGLDKARTKKKLNTKDVKTISRTLTQKTRTTAPAKKGKNKQASKVKPPSPKEKKAAAAFTEALKSVEKTLKPFCPLVDKRGERERFTEVLLSLKTDVKKPVNTLYSFFTKIREELAEAKRRRLVGTIN